MLVVWQQLRAIAFAERSVRRYDTKTMKKPKRSHYNRLIGAAEAFIEKRLTLGRVAFSLEELVKESGLSAIAAKFQLLRVKCSVVVSLRLLVRRSDIRHHDLCDPRLTIRNMRALVGW